MIKANHIKKSAAAFSTVIAMFAALGVAAFAENDLTISAIGAADNMYLKIDYILDEESEEADSAAVTFSIKYPRTCHLAFSTSAAQTTIKFFKNGNERPTAAFTTPVYFSGMPSRLITGVYLEAGEYTVTVSSAEDTKPASGYFELGAISGIKNAADSR